MSNAVAEEPADLSAEAEEDNTNQFVTFHVAKEVFGFPMESVLEIIRLPTTVSVPLTANALLGLANLRGSVLPILDLRRLLKLDSVEYGEATRVIVTDAGTPVGLVVDKVARVMNVEPNLIDTTSQEKSTIEADMLDGVIKGGEGEALIQLLNVKQLISENFSTVLSSAEQKSDMNSNTGQSNESELDEDDDTDQLVSFSVENQEYAFNLMEVEEIVRVPESIAKVPRTDEHVLGLIDLRGRLLPLVSLRRMFELKEAPISEDNRILVVNLLRKDGHKDSVGLVVDDVKEVLHVTHDVQDQMPALFSQGDNSRDIDRVCRLENGKRLVSVMQANALFAYPAIQEAIEASDNEQEDNDMAAEQLNQAADTDDDDTAQLVVFQLGEQEYGVNIDDVQEITRVQEKLDKVPKTADFIEGMVNLRGTVLPVLDMRRRFDMDKMERNDRQRIIVLSLEGVRTGFIVDFVAEVLRLPHHLIENSPNLSDDQSRIMGQVVNLKEQKRMIQVLTSRELLSEQEISTISEEL